MNKSLKWIITITVAAVLISGGYKGYNFLSSPELCNSCHYMNTKYATWQRSTHAGVKCIICHSGQGKRGKLIAYLKGLRYVKVSLTGRLTRPIIKADGDDPARLEGCIKCHSRDGMVSRERKLYPLKRVHTNHEALALRCTDCHADLVHSAIRQIVQLVPSGESCEECHRRENMLLRASR